MELHFLLFQTNITSVFWKFSTIRVIFLFNESVNSLIKKMTSQTQGIQQLLAAEKKAAEKVSEARKRKARRLKQAKDEATEEIEKYRKVRERQFREFETKHMGSREGVAAKIDADGKVKLDEMNRAIQTRKHPVITEILQYVYNINPEMHKNYRSK